MAAVCLVDTLEQCRKEENERIDPASGKKIKRFFPLIKRGERGGRAFFRSEVSAFLTDGVVLTFVYWVKDPSGSGMKTKDVRYVMYSKAAGGGGSVTAPPTPGSSTVTPTPTPSPGSSTSNPDQIVRTYCTGGGCHESGAIRPTLTSLADAKANGAANSIATGRMPKFRSIPELEKQALLNALNR